VAQVHDTDIIPERDRVDLLNTAFANSESPQSVTYVATDSIRHRMELFDLGAGAHLLRNTGTGLRIVRSERHVRLGAPDQLAVCMQSKGTGLAMTGAGSELHLPGELWFLDTTRPYTYQQSAVSDHKVMLVDPTLLDLPIDVLRSAMPGLKASPVYSLVRAHFVELCNTTTDLPPRAAASVREATVHLIRALVTTAVDDKRQGEAMHDSQVLRITMFIEAHLHDRTLTVERIAGAHGISARQLYNVWARAGKDASLAEWIMQRRLDRARQGLAGADPTATIATVARTSGFTNMSHFSQRFRDAFGMSPREWRYLHRVEG
jgi:AraC family transcriptional regulator, positive regulator of tynA and feaB